MCQEVLKAVGTMMPEEEISWMIDLGYQLTVCARGAYPFGHELGNLNNLLGFNELQHQIYGRIRHLRRGEAWTLKSFFEGLSQKAEHYGITRDLDSALKASSALGPSPRGIQ
jgi:hypothetical protein